MNLNCPNENCSSHGTLNARVYENFVSPKSRPIVRKGFYVRQEDRRRVRRYLCRLCGKSFSRAGLGTARYQKMRRITPLLHKLICSGVSQRRAALILGVNSKTVVRRFRFLAREARRNQQHNLADFKKNPISEIQFDDLETSEHTKCKPLSVALAV